MLLEVNDIHVRYGAIHALKGVSLHVDQGEIVTLIGSNGAGKSTTLNAIVNQVKKSAGSIRFLGEDIIHKSTHEIIHMGIGYAPEGRSICSRLTVYENLQVGRFARRGGDGAGLERVYELFPILKERSRQQAGTLSGGEQQMLAIGRALICNPQLLLLDEPSLGLSPALVKTIFALIRRIRMSGVTVLLIEQNARMALKTADRGYVLSTGNVLMQDDSAALLENSDVRRAYLGIDE